MPLATSCSQVQKTTIRSLAHCLALAPCRSAMASRQSLMRMLYCAPLYSMLLSTQANAVSSTGLTRPALARTLLQDSSAGQANIRDDPVAGQTQGDNRSPVPDATQFPYPAIGLVVVALADGSFTRCTGVLIAPAVVLTAAHW